MVTVSSILSAICDKDSGTLRTLKGVELLFREGRNGESELVHFVGNMSVVLRVNYQGRPSQLKCYTSKHPYLKQIYGERLFSDELIVFSIDGSRSFVDVVLDDWREGETLLRTLKDCAHSVDKEMVKLISKNFDTLALEMLSSPWAHGDLTTENIIVGSDLSLSLIDFDALYTPSLSGEKCCEMGTYAFQHPSRGVDSFDEYIADYPIALISTALHLLSFEPTLFDEHSDSLLFTPHDILEQSSHIYTHALDRLSAEGLAVEYRIAQLLTSQNYRLPELRPLLEYLLRDGLTEVPSESYVKGGAWGFLSSDEDGAKEVIPPLYNSAFDFTCSVAAVKVGCYWHYINTQGEVVKRCNDCQMIKPARNNRFRFMRSGEWEEEMESFK